MGAVAGKPGKLLALAGMCLLQSMPLPVDSP